MNQVSMNLRLRPVRFAFLVRPDNSEKIFETFCTNTCLWGGKFNPIIPIQKTVKELSQKELQVLKEYLDFFEPDFIVETEEGLSKGINFDRERILNIKNLLEETSEDDKPYLNLEKHGQSVTSLYRDIQSKYKYLKFDPQSLYKTTNIIYVEEARGSEESKSNRFKNFIACYFGDFPENEEVWHFKSNYRRLFPGVKYFGQNNSDLIYNFRYQSPLDIGCKKINIDYFNEVPYLFLLDAENNKDLIDFWNLRAVYKNIIGIPIQTKDLSDILISFVSNNNNHKEEKDLIELEKHFGIKNSSKVFPIFFSSISKEKKEEIEQIYKNCIQSFYKNDRKWKIEFNWMPAKDFIKTATRPILEVDRKNMDIKVDKNNTQIKLDHLYPKVDKSGNSFLWANVVQLKDSNNKIATALPCNYTKNFVELKIIKEFDDHLEWELSSVDSSFEEPNGERIKKTLLSTTEGLVVFSHDKNFIENWNLVNGETVIKNWLEENQKIKSAELSDAGRASQQVIQSLGFDGIDILTNKQIIELLNNISKKRLKSYHFDHFEGEIKKAITSTSNNTENRRSEQKNISKTLVKKQTIKLGMEIKCDKCNKWSWYSIDKLNYSLICDFCLKLYQFPSIDPKLNKCINWAYRTIGPFALSDYAQGGYAVALSVRFFTDTIGRYNKRFGLTAPPSRFFSGKHFLDDKITWSSGQELEVTSGKKIEVDFILWSQRPKSNKTNNLTNMIFGEAKSYNCFKQEEIDKMKSLAEIFPGAILVFSTMREAINKEEVKSIRKLAEWGRKNKTTPVIILTGTELFTKESLIKSWYKGDKKYKELARNIGIGCGGDITLRNLARYTQYLYLGMPLKKHV